MRALSIAVTALMFSVITLVFVINHDTKERHEHIIHPVKHKNWKFNYNATICLTDSMQVTQSGKHWKTQLSEDYFKDL